MLQSGDFIGAEQIDFFKKEILNLALEVIWQTPLNTLFIALFFSHF